MEGRVLIPAAKRAIMAALDGPLPNRALVRIIIDNVVPDTCLFSGLDDADMNYFFKRDQLRELNVCEPPFCATWTDRRGGRTCVAFGEKTNVDYFSEYFISCPGATPLAPLRATVSSKYMTANWDPIVNIPRA